MSWNSFLSYAVIRVCPSNSYNDMSRFGFMQVAYQRILQLTYVDDLLAAIKSLFVKLFEPFLATFVASLHVLNGKTVKRGGTIQTWDFSKAFEGWDKVFDKVLKGLEDKAALVSLSSDSVSNICAYVYLG